MMYWNDHEPAHFHVHALFAEHRAIIAIETLSRIDGYLPKSKLRAVLSWAEPRMTALWNAWHNTQARLPVGPIK